MGIPDQSRVSPFENESTRMRRREPRPQQTFSIDDPMATYGQKKVPVSLTLKEAPIMNIDIAQSPVIRYIVQKTHYVCRPGGR
jgi:hypothetical protein